MLHKRHGSGLIMLLFSILIIAIGSIMVSKAYVVPGGKNGPTPIDRSWEAVCAANKSLISQQLQLYTINNEPMKQLDLQRLFSGSFRLPEKCPCSYSFDTSGKVTCKAHP